MGWIEPVAELGYVVAAALFIVGLKKLGSPRTAVTGKMKSANILAACKAKGLTPVCDHANYGNGQCVVVSGQWHFSHPSHSPAHRARGAFALPWTLSDGKE